MASVDLLFVPEYPDLGEEPDIPPRSRLFALEPLAVGTTAAEGLISYIIRLAEAYSVGPRRLIRDEFSKVCPEIARFRRGPFFERDARTVNGLHWYSRWFSGAVGQLCGITAEHLTLLPLAGLLPHNGAGLIAATPRWCPACYAGMMKAGQAIYHPLAWSFDIYRVCPRHGQSMADHCPSCGKLQYPIPRSPGIGYCSQCGKWLGQHSGRQASTDPLECWAAGAIEEIVAELPRLNRLATRNRFLHQIGKAVDRFAEGNLARFCREIGLPPFALKNWLGRGERPSLPQWLSVAHGLGVGPVQFLEEVSTRHEGSLFTLPGKLKPRAARHRLTPAQGQAIRRDLDTLVTAGGGKVSIAMLTEKYGLKRSHLKYRWPEQCRQISFDCRQAAKAKTSALLEHQCQTARQAIDDLLDDGVYPSQRIVLDTLDRVGISLANPAIREAYRQHLKFRLGRN